MIWVKAKPETLSSNQKRRTIEQLEERNESENDETKEINEN
jgi:hypothetical protein